MFNGLAIVLALLILQACDGGSGPAAPPPVTTPPPNYSGTYVGPMLYNDGTSEVNPTGRTTVNHTGSMVQFGLLSITAASGPREFLIAGETLSDDNTVTGINHGDPTPNLKPDCGGITVRTACRFEGRLMNGVRLFWNSRSSVAKAEGCTT